jgi:hypothetical protein
MQSETPKVIDTAHKPFSLQDYRVVLAKLQIPQPIGT